MVQHTQNTMSKACAFSVIDGVDSNRLEINLHAVSVGTILGKILIT